MTDESLGDILRNYRVRILNNSKLAKLNSAEISRIYDVLIEQKQILESISEITAVVFKLTDETVRLADVVIDLQKRAKSLEAWQSATVGATPPPVDLDADQQRSL